MSNMRCPICGSNSENGRLLSSKCMFTKRDLVRTECCSCGVVFGPEYMMSSTDEFISSEYEKLYKTYGEGDTTKYGTQTFNDMSPSKDGTYLDYGCGRWSRTEEVLSSSGYKVKGYDPYVNVPGEHMIADISGKTFDGIFSHNVIEHLRDPVSTFKVLSRMLKPHGIMAHSTECYDYKIEYSQFHLFFFKGTSVERLCDKTGFSLLDRKTYPEYKCCIFRKDD